MADLRINTLLGSLNTNLDEDDGEEDDDVSVSALIASIRRQRLASSVRVMMITMYPMDSNKEP